MAAVHLADGDEEIGRCFQVMAQLRPHLLEAEFVTQVRAQQSQGYQLAYLLEDGAVVAVSGFRVMGMLLGRTLYVDDLVTDYAQRTCGYGKAMLEWLESRAREAGCTALTLDSGTHRQEAHAFYFRERMRVVSFHFAKKLA